MKNAIISLAILKVNWDEYKKDYLENFAPLIIEVIKNSDHEIITLIEVQKELDARFGLRIPQNAIRTLLIRLNKRGYLKKDNGIYYKNLDKLNEFTFDEVQKKVLNMHEKLVEMLIQYCKEKYDTHLTVDQAEEVLKLFFMENELVVSGQTNYGNIIPPMKNTIKHAKFLVGSFINYLYETKSSALEYLDTIIIGNMLANAVFLPNPQESNRNFKRTDVYLDTNFLISVLGYAGQPRQAPCEELLILLYETGANLKCFSHTVEEIRGILDACSKIISKGKLKDAYGPSIEHFIAENYSASDIELISVQLEKDLTHKRVKIVDKPPYIHKYNVDEQKLSNLLREKLSYNKEQALTRDCDSISAIIRLRRDKESYYIEECRAIFVTTNSNLVTVANQFFYEEYNPKTITPCITDYSLTNLLWLKKPLNAPDLPRKRIIADCYAAIQPSEKLWRKYIEEIERLEKTQKVPFEDYYLLRYSLYAKNALMDITLGESEGFTQGTVSEVLSLVRFTIDEHYRKQIKEVEESKRRAEEEVAAAKSDKSTQLKTISNRSISIARIVTNVFKVLVILFLAFGTITTFPWFEFRPNFELLLFLTQTILLILIVANLMFGTKVDVLLRAFEIKLSGWLFFKLTSLLSYKSEEMKIFWITNRED